MLNQRFNEDGTRQLSADGQPRIANEANDVRLAGQQLDDLLLAEADFAQPLRHFRRGTQLFDPNRHAGLDPIQRAKFAALLVAGCAKSLIETHIHCGQNAS